MKWLMISLIAGAAGVASTLAGLGIDAWLHAEDPTLAQREGIFTLSNPGHVLLALGVLLTCAGLLSALHIAWGLARPGGLLGKPYVRTLSLRASAIASVAAVVFVLSVSASGHEHAHGDESVPHVHEDGALHTHDEAVDSALVATLSMEPPSPVNATGHQHGSVSATPEEIACGNDLVSRTQEATARFVDFDVSAAEGYRSNPSKPNATHFANPAYQFDGKIMDLAHPETLIYWTNPDTDEKVLIGVMFKMPRGQSGPQPCGAVTYWHTHASCRDLATRSVVPVDHGTACPDGFRYAESAEMMHVWFIPGRKNGVAPAI